MSVKKGDAKNKPSDYYEGQLPSHDRSYKQLLDLCNQLKGQKDHTSLEAYSKEFSSATGQISQEIENFKAKISSIPFVAVIIFWAKFTEKDRAFGARYLDMMRDLIAMGILPYKNEKGIPLTIQDFKLLNPLAVVDAIRCNNKWQEQKREDYVSFYIEFVNWLSETTSGYVSIIQDPDRQLTLRRQLPYEAFVEILTSLSLREKIIAKIFYLGGNRSSDEVLSLKIEDIHFPECKLNLSGCWVSYPRHVLTDLKGYIGKRKRGYVFVGRDGEKTDPTVPYRALKTVISRLKLDPSFTFKDFGRNL